MDFNFLEFQYKLTYMDPEADCLNNRHIWPALLFAVGSPATGEICSMPLVFNDLRHPFPKESTEAWPKIITAHYFVGH